MRKKRLAAVFAVIALGIGLLPGMAAFADESVESEPGVTDIPQESVDLEVSQSGRAESVEEAAHSGTNELEEVSESEDFTDLLEGATEPEDVTDSLKGIPEPEDVAVPEVTGVESFDHGASAGRPCKPFNDTWGTVKWSLTSDCTLHIGPGKLKEFPLNGYGNPSFPWNAGDVKKIVFEGTRKNPTIAPKNSSYFFADMINLKSIVNAQAFDTSRVTNMIRMFHGSVSLASVDVSKWDTSNVTLMNSTFGWTSSLQSIDVSKWDTSSLTSMNFLFLEASSLKTVDLTKWDTSNVTSMVSSFHGASSLKSLDLSSWDTRKAFRYRHPTTNDSGMLGMFSKASSLTKLRLGVNSWLADDVGLLDSNIPRHTGQWMLGDAAGNPLKNSAMLSTPELVKRSRTDKAPGWYLAQLTKAFSGVKVASGSRLAGSDRFDTGVQISKGSFAPGVPVVFVASGLNFPDALSAAAAAGAGLGPVLLIPGSSVPGNVKAELKRLKPGRIVVVGGTSSVSDTAMASLKAFTKGKVSRISGADRFATSAQISAHSFKPGVRVAYVAGGLDFPDALAAAAPAAHIGGPVLLVGKDSVSAEVKAELERLRPTQIMIIGGKNSVSDAVWDELWPVMASRPHRLSGESRFETATQTSARYFAPGVKVAFVASGESFPDALAAGGVAGALGGPVILVQKNDVPGEVKSELARLKPERVIVVGGPNTISPGALKEVRNYQTHK